MYTVVHKNVPHLFFEGLCETLADFNNFLARDIRKELDANDYSFGYLTLIRLLHYLVKCRSRSLAISNNEFILDSTRVGSEMID